MKESVLQASIVEAAGYFGWHHYHTHDSRRSNAGFPDLVLANPRQRRVIFRELKAGKGRVSLAQARWIDVLKRSGQDARVWYEDDWVDGRILADLKGDLPRWLGDDAEDV